MGNSYEYIKRIGGLMPAEYYPLGADSSQYPCKYNNTKSVKFSLDYVFLPPGDEETLKNAVATLGPVSVGINGSPDSFLSYWSGVYDDESCSQWLTHAVLIVGYGTNEFGDFWICKNSW